MTGATDGQLNDDQLQQLIAEALWPWLEVHSDEVADWVMTGVPTNFDFVRPTRHCPRNDSLYAAAKAVGSADPMVEWRLGLAIDEPRLGPLRALNLHSLVPGGPTDERIAELLSAAGVEDADVVREALIAGYNHVSWKPAIRKRPLFIRLLRAHPAAAAAALDHDVNRIEIAAQTLADTVAGTPEALNPMAETIAELMTDTSKKRRAAGVVLAAVVDSDVLVPHLKRLAVETKASSRAEALRGWARLDGGQRIAEVIEFADEHCAGDRSATVHSAIEDLRAIAAVEAPAAKVALPEIDQTPPRDGARASFQRVFDRSFDRHWQHHLEMVARVEADPSPEEWEVYAAENPPERTSPELIERLWDYVVTGAEWPTMATDFRDLDHDLYHLDFELFGVLHIFRLARLWSFRINWRATLYSLSERYRETGHPSLIEVQAAAEAVGVDRELVVRELRKPMWWGRQSVAEFATALLPELTARIEAGTSHPGDRIDKYYAIAFWLPELPMTLRQILESQAIGKVRSLRPLAQLTLGGSPEVIATATRALSSRRSGERAAAATWLADLGATGSVDDLRRAAAKEKHQAALDAQLNAIESLGGAPDQYRGDDELIATAKRELAKGMPKDGRWIVVGGLPNLTWADGATVDPVITEWLVVQAVRSKSATPSPTVRELFDRMDPASTRRFAAELLGAWMVQDLAPISAELAESRARRDARAALRYHNDKYPGMTEDEIFTRMLESHVITPVGSASGSKGLLSLVAAAGDVSVVAPAEHYIRQWYGTRASQSKALIEMLAWIDDPVAAQFLFSVAAGFRTKGFQTEARRQLERLAERRGITLEELGGRSVPDGGFGADGTLVLDYGRRTFHASLTDDLDIVLRTDDGTQIDELPAPTRADDLQLVERAKHTLDYARLHVASVLREQPIILAAVAPPDRELRIEDFRRRVLGHPLMLRLATRMVWLVVTGPVTGRDWIEVRPLSDGTLIDVDDNEFDLGTGTRVSLRYGPGERSLPERWRTHFADYDIVPLVGP